MNRTFQDQEVIKEVRYKIRMYTIALIANRSILDFTLPESDTWYALKKTIDHLQAQIDVYRGILEGAKEQYPKSTEGL
jgi:hypothetical protein